MRNSEECWLETLLPQLLAYKSSGRQYRARVLSVSYEGRADMGEHGETKGTEDSDEYELVERLILDLIIGESVDLGQRIGVPVFLVGHDLGGILIKLFVMRVEAEEAAAAEGTRPQRKLRAFLENLKSVFFYATPHSGAPVLDRLAEIIPTNKRNEMLRFMKVLNAEKSRLNQAFHSYRNGPANLGLSKFSTIAIHALHNTYLEALNKFVKVVPEGTERSGVDTFYSVSADHFQVCQPEGTFTSSAQKLRDEIKRVLEEQEESRKKAVSCADREQAPPSSEVRDKRKDFLSKVDPAGDRVVVCTSSTQASAPKRIRR